MAGRVRAREFNARGIAKAREFLAEVRRNPTGRKTPPEELLLAARYTRSFRGGLMVDSQRHAFGSRREIGSYLAPRLAPFRARIADRTSLWSWLGIFHFEDTVRIVDGAARLSPLDETFVIDRLDRQNLRGIHRHYLRSAWLLWETHRDDAAFLLDQPPTARGFMADRILQSQRIFNSAGIVPLIISLYTNGKRQKRGFQGQPGGLRHLLRVLDQLERTHDVYGMNPEALVRILPPEFAPWVDGADLTADTRADPGAAGQAGAEADRSDRSPRRDRDAPGPEPDRASTPDPKLRKWEEAVRRTGRGTMRYRGFCATVRIDEASGALTGAVTTPESRPIGTVSAMEASEFKRALRETVDSASPR